MKPIYIIFVVVVLALTGGLLWYRAESIEAAATLTTRTKERDDAVDANKAQEKTIADLQGLRALDSIVINNLTAEVNALNVAATKQHNDVANLERSNNEVRTYLSSPIPADLARLLNN